MLTELSDDWPICRRMLAVDEIGTRGNLFGRVKYAVGFGYCWRIRQDGGFEAVGAYGQSVTIYPKERLVIAVNSASVDHHGIGLARWDLIAAIEKAAG